MDEDDEEEEEDEVEEGWEQHKANRENEKGPSARDIENERRLASDLDGVDEEQIEQYYRYYSRTPLERPRLNLMKEFHLKGIQYWFL